MKIIVTHTSPDWDAIASVWLIKKYLSGWNEAEVRFVPAGERLKNSEFRIQNSELDEPIEKSGKDEIIHVDTGLGPLDHHQTDDQDTCAASLTWEFVKKAESLKRSSRSEAGKTQSSEREKVKEEAITRIVKVVVDIDHFKEVFWEDATSDYHEFSLLGVLDGLKLQKPNEDDYYIEFGMALLDALLHHFENRIWAEREIRENGNYFQTKWGKGIGFDTVNDTVLKLAQKMGYVIVIRKDPRKGYVRIKARPIESNQDSGIRNKGRAVDLTLVYEKLKKMDPKATWFLHVSKKMLLNGTPKNPKMVATKLSLGDIIKVLENI